MITVRFPSAYTCVSCGARYCCVRCLGTHKDTRYAACLDSAICVQYKHCHVLQVSEVDSMIEGYLNIQHCLAVLNMI